MAKAATTLSLNERMENPAVIKLYDFEVSQWMPFAVIDEIAKMVVSESNYENRQQLIVYLVLKNATNLSEEVIDNLNVNKLIVSGVWEEIKGSIKNFYEISDAIRHYESVPQILADLAKAIPNALEQGKEKFEQYLPTFISQVQEMSKSE